MGSVLGLAPAQAKDSDRSPLQLQSDLRAALLERCKELGIPASLVEDVRYTPSFDVVTEYKNDPYGFVRSIAEQIFPEVCGSCLPSDEGSSTAEISSGTITPYANYNAQVFAGVPAGGVCQVRQDFSATVSNYKVTSKKILGSSYVVGFCLCVWTPNRAWFGQSGREFYVYMKGTFSALIKGSPLSFSATFKAIFDINKTSLKQHFQ